MVFCYLKVGKCAEALPGLLRHMLENKNGEKMKYKCPYCERKVKLDCRVSLDVKYFGLTEFHYPCVYCNKMLYVFVERKVVITSVFKSDRKIEDGDFYSMETK